MADRPAPSAAAAEARGLKTLLFARARGFRLYDTAGRRYLDLWLAGGEALLGHRCPRATRAVSAALSHGLAAGLPTPWVRRLERELERWFPERRSFRVYATRDRALAAATRWVGMRAEPPDPAVGPVARSCPASLWRPLLPEGRNPGAGVEVVIPVLPWTLGGSPAAACFASRLAPGEEPSDPAPAVAVAGAVHVLGGLRQAGREDPFGDLALAAAPGWARSGPYVVATFAPELWDKVVARFLAAGVLLPPRYPGPAILPAEASPGERRLIAGLFRTIPGPTPGG